MSTPALTFEGSIDIINNEINKRRHRWNLTAIAWMDFDDVAQIIRLHIYKKWHLYKPEKPLCPWINTIISNQMKNLMRNIYLNHSRPCLNCAASEGSNDCRIYIKQCNDCPLYANWEKNKKSAHDTKLPVSLELHTQEVHNKSDDFFDIEKASEILHSKMKEVLKPLEWKVYYHLYIENKTEEETAVLMGYKTNEKGRAPGYKRVCNVKKIIIVKVKKILKKGEVEFGI